jgi:hypothetical protein
VSPYHHNHSPHAQRGTRSVGIYSRNLVQPGNVFDLPFPFDLRKPNLFLYRRNNQEDFLTESEETGVYFGQWGGEPYEVILGAKTRPFLIIQHSDLLTMMDESQVDSWYGDGIVGLPLSSAVFPDPANPRKKLLPLSKIEEIRQNKFQHVHYLALRNNPNCHLKRESVVVISKPMSIPFVYFTSPRHLGHVSPGDWGAILCKARLCWSLSIQERQK